ncbi:hypothetical protein CRV08_07705 [Halarcobacter ebronensis]|uniref:EAL domain-containing protein n=2 Tax=Halarcobacter ebronensis TaxID=1462615 RepID=A0A4Q0YDQ2_9BACT|nr:hypothetical protein CRV08_07705 [Halarcobacter ebronensis]
MSLFQTFCKYFYKNKTKTIFIIDILYMKDINAFYGFKNGDYILSQLCKLLKNKIKRDINHCLEKSSCIEIKKSHVDVFTITIFDDLVETDILKIKNIIFDNIVGSEFKILNSKVAIDIDITIGCSKGEDKDLLVYAERALHNAKMNYIHFMYYDAKLYKNQLVNEELVKTLHRNIEEKKVEPYFQPIMDNKTQQITKYEALMRIYDNEGNIIMPQAFIEKARKYRLFNKLMELLILKVIEYIKLYKISVSINLDYTDILNPTMKNLIIENLRNDDIGHYLTIEILESKKISNYYLVNEFINDLKAYDVKIAIDDFGSGFSNYEHILNINTDYIKLDGSLIKKIDENVYYNLVKSIVLFCKEQNIKVVAEFVSDLRIHRYVKSLDIDYSQGYYIGKPQKINEIIESRNER